MDLGGPLTASIKARPGLLSGRVTLDYGGCKNAAGTEYEYYENKPRSFLERQPAPAFEIVNEDSAGNAVKVFEHFNMRANKTCLVLFKNKLDKFMAAV